MERNMIVPTQGQVIMLCWLGQVFQVSSPAASEAFGTCPHHPRRASREQNRPLYSIHQGRVGLRCVRHELIRRGFGRFSVSREDQSDSLIPPRQPPEDNSQPINSRHGEAAGSFRVGAHIGASDALLFGDAPPPTPIDRRYLGLVILKVVLWQAVEFPLM